jgi:hypothetical protein
MPSHCQGNYDIVLEIAYLLGYASQVEHTGGFKAEGSSNDLPNGVAIHSLNQAISGWRSLYLRRATISVSPWLCLPDQQIGLELAVLRFTRRGNILRLSEGDESKC